ncbi:hypothetical protein EAF07_06390 [Streptococcus hillyeri]|uniref:Uncharacterized protein n=1 Tax=Streptococcus hillyeri TaxID=2282420 RepID=A0A3L9DRR0_9STRE|nr:hypothetical protein EAF07_06390 [Streptococcus hillyeri]
MINHQTNIDHFRIRSYGKYKGLTEAEAKRKQWVENDRKREERLLSLENCSENQPPSERVNTIDKEV